QWRQHCLLHDRSSLQCFSSSYHISHQRGGGNAKQDADQKNLWCKIRGDQCSHGEENDQDQDGGDEKGGSVPLDTNAPTTYAGEKIAQTYSHQLEAQMEKPEKPT